MSHGNERPGPKSRPCDSLYRLRPDISPFSADNIRHVARGYGRAGSRGHGHVRGGDTLPPEAVRNTPAGAGNIPVLADRRVPAPRRPVALDVRLRCVARVAAEFRCAHPCPLALRPQFQAGPLREPGASSYAGNDETLLCEFQFGSDFSTLICLNAFCHHYADGQVRTRRCYQMHEPQEKGRLRSRRPSLTCRDAANGFATDRQRTRHQVG
jgi:hypothetical protein